MQSRSVLVLVAALVFSSAAAAHSFTAGNLRIGHPFARSTVPGQSSGAAYLSIENAGPDADKLIAVASPAAKGAELHSMKMDGNVMKMREVQAIEIGPAARVSMKPGEIYHIMLTGLNQPLKVGDKFPLTLTFEKAGKVEVTVIVQDRDRETAPAKDAGAAHQH